MDYERAHGARLPVLELLRRRLEAVEAGAQPSPGDPAAAQPEHAPPPQGGSPVAEASGPGEQPAPAPRRRREESEPKHQGPMIRRCRAAAAPRDYLRLPVTAGAVPSQEVAVHQ